MNFLNLNLRKIVLLFFACLLPLISINVQQKPVESNWVSRPFFLFAQVIENVFYAFSAEVRNTTGLYVNLVNIKKDNGSLKIDNEKLQAELQILKEKEFEIDRLRQLLEFKQSTPMKLISAEIVGKDLITDHNTLTINKGTADGVKSGMGVITLDGVIGYTFRPEPHQTSVMLITDRYSVVDGVVQRTRARGIVEGKGTQECSLKYVERTEDVRIGDMIVTGGLDNLFPKGFPIATVESVERKTHSVSLKVELKPLVEPNKVEEVFIVSDAKEQDLGEKFMPKDLQGANGFGNGASEPAPAKIVIASPPPAPAKPAKGAVAKPKPTSPPATQKKPAKKSDDDDTTDNQETP